MPAYDAILFDFDGVLIDTEPIHWECWRELLQPHGVDLDWETYRDHCIGVADYEMLEMLGAKANPPVPVDPLWAQYGPKKALFNERMATDPTLPEGNRELLKELRSSHRLGLVTSSARAEIAPLVKALCLEEYFDTMVFSEDVTSYKPHPEPYRLAAERLGSKRALVVEDSDAGIESGLAAGFDVLRIDNAVRTAELVRERLANLG